MQAIEVECVDPAVEQPAARMEPRQTTEPLVVEPENISEHQSMIAEALDSQSEAQESHCTSTVVHGSTSEKSRPRDGAERLDIRRISICQCELSKKHLRDGRNSYRTAQRVVNFIESLRKRDDKSVFKFEIAWDPAQHLKHRLPKDLGHHVLIAPYQGEMMTHLHITPGELPDKSPFTTAIRNIQKQYGVKVMTGFWRDWSNPLAILLDVKHVSKDFAKVCRSEFKKDFNIEILDDDTHYGNPVVFGCVVAQFLIQFELAAKEDLSAESRVSFINWDAAPGLMFFVRHCGPIMKVTFVLFETSLGELQPKTRIIAEKLAQEAELYNQFLFERAALRNANDVVVAKPLTVLAVSKQLQCGPPVRYSVYVSRSIASAKMLSYVRATRHKETKRMVEQMATPVRDCYIHNNLTRIRGKSRHAARGTKLI